VAWSFHKIDVHITQRITQYGREPVSISWKRRIQIANRVVGWRHVKRIVWNARAFREPVVVGVPRSRRISRSGRPARGNKRFHRTDDAHVILCTRTKHCRGLRISNARVDRTRIFCAYAPRSVGFSNYSRTRCLFLKFTRCFARRTLREPFANPSSMSRIVARRPHLYTYIYVFRWKTVFSIVRRSRRALRSSTPSWSNSRWTATIQRDSPLTVYFDREKNKLYAHIYICVCVLLIFYFSRS